MKGHFALVLLSMVLVSSVLEALSVDSEAASDKKAASSSEEKMVLETYSLVLSEVPLVRQSV